MSTNLYEYEGNKFEPIYKRNTDKCKDELTKNIELNGEEELSNKSKTFIESGSHQLEAFSELSKTEEYILQWWIGNVDEIFNGFFSATLIDLEGNETLVEFDNDQVSKLQREFIKPNAQFTFYITQYDNEQGQRERISRLEFSIYPEKIPYKSIKELDDYIEKSIGDLNIFDE